jgi:hypothetical protein
VVVVQELGGFASVIGTYLAARTSAVDNLFIEPSFYRGRFFVTRNSFAAPRMSEWTAEPELDPDSVIYLRALQKTRAIVIPVKDRHHYRRAWSKLSNARNVVRLGEKIYEKYWRHQRHEFGYIGHHVLSHLRMAANSAHLRKAYAALDSVSPFIYYPLHVPADVALTIRAPAYVDQLALVDYLARNLPTPYKLVIKEHPAQIGALDIARIRELLRRHDNLALLSPHTNNYDVLAQCTVVVSVNSKAGAEALLMRKPTVVLGDAFYARDELVTRAAHLDDVPAAIDEVLRAPRLPSERVVEAFFSNVWRQTFPGELYTGSAEGQETFANSLHRAIIAQ